MKSYYVNMTYSITTKQNLSILIINKHNCI